MRVAFDVVDTLIQGLDIERPREDVMRLYRAFRAMPRTTVVVWSSDVELAREVIGKYRLAPDGIFSKSQKDLYEIDIAFDDTPESVRHQKVKQVFKV